MQLNISPGSEAKLLTCAPELVTLVRVVAVKIPLIVLCGARDEIDQNHAFESGLSKLKYPHSLHNSNPSRAVDLAPKPWNPTDTKAFYYFAGYVMGVAATMGLSLRWGGSWSGSLNFNENSFNDLCHFELIKP